MLTPVALRPPARRSCLVRNENPARTKGQLFARASASPPASLDDVTGGAPILVIAPHPDDDVLGCGGLIAACAAANVPVHIAYLTDGRRSHVGSAQWPGERLAAARRLEAIEGARALGLAPDALTFLPNRDGALLFDRNARRRSLAALQIVARRHGAARVFTTWIHDPHPDHVAAALIARELCDLPPYPTQLAYPVWGRFLPDGFVLRHRARRALRFDVGAHAETKRRAFAAHRSQSTKLIDDAWFTLSPKRRQRETLLREAEFFLV